MSDSYKDSVECQVCHRIEFNSKATECAECWWPIRPVVLDEPVYGFDLCVQIRECNRLGTVTKHFKTDKEARARASAKRSVRNFVAVLAVRPLTEQQYIGAYGAPGRM